MSNEPKCPEMDIERTSKEGGAVELEKIDTSPDTTKRDIDIPLTADETRVLKRATYVSNLLYPLRV
jgi:hypothetical protein